MKKSVFLAQVNKSEELLKKLDILAERKYPSYSSYGRSINKNKKYIDIWKNIYSNNIYDFRLKDDSLIQFYSTFRPLRMSYSFLECPFHPMLSFDDYFAQQKLEIEGYIDEIEINRQYELLQPTPKNSVTPLRYDYNPDTYKECYHPASHMHFGHESNIRVTTQRILRPISFILFLIRQYYPKDWLNFVNRNDAPIICRNVKDKLDQINESYLNEKDYWEMHLL